MNWEKKELHYVRDILSPPFTIQGDGRVIQSVYDPFAIAFGGEIWMAFECATPQSTSSCIAPLDMKGAVVTRVSVPVSGGPKTSEEQWGVSASDPKLLFFRQHLYLYWTVIRFDGQGWIDGTTRGTELVEDNLRERRLWAKDAVGQPVRSDDKKRTVEVLGLAPLDATSDTFADVFGIYTNDESVFAIAALGGHGTAPGEKCLSPLGSSFGCYRLEISRANRPLQNRAFNDGELSVVGFPENPQEYSRIVEGPNGKLFIMGMYFDPPEKYAAKYQGHTVPHGLRLYPISIK
jgi:hypothetical protein